MTGPNQPADRYRLRLLFSKNPQIKYISHLDLSLTWERALRRAQIPLAYSQGFNPRPRMQFASGLPLGTSGTSEIVDIILTEPVQSEEVLARIRAALPAGIGLHSAREVPLKSPTLQQLLRQAEYEVWVETDLSEVTLARRIADLLAADRVVQARLRRRRAEEVDLRPWLHELQLDAVGDGKAKLIMRLAAGQFGNLRPEDVLKALGLAENWAEIERKRLIFEEEITAK
jgi:radical SAM-linked protein